MVIVLILLLVATNAARGAIASVGNNIRDSNIPTRVPHRVRVRVRGTGSRRKRRNNNVRSQIEVYPLLLFHLNGKVNYIVQGKVKMLTGNSRSQTGIHMNF